MAPIASSGPKARRSGNKPCPNREWDSADAVFTGDTDEEGMGRWRFPKAPLGETWPMKHDGIDYLGRFTSFRHVGVFPEQASHWDHMAELIRKAGRPVKVLNLFGYTGLASLVAARAGAEVTHVDASKKAIGWARENQQIARLGDKPIRWICEDAMKFAEREERRGSFYDIILFDPPAYGRGPKGEVWQLFEDLPAMTDICRSILTPKPLAVVLTAYSIRASFFAIHALMRDTFAGMGGVGRIGRTDHPRKIGRTRPVDVTVLTLGGVMTGQRAGGAPGQVKEITSLANPLVKDIKALALKKFRDQQNAFMAEGLKLVIDALDLGWSIKTLVFAKSARGNAAVEKVAARTVAAGGTVLEVSEKVLTAITRRDNPQAVVGVFAQRFLPLKDIRPANGDVWVALDRVRDPGNLGTVIRTVDAVGAKGVILVGETTDPFSLETVRATMGSIFAVPVARATAEAFLAWRKGFSGPGRRHPSQGCGRLSLGGFRQSPGASSDGQRTAGPARRSGAEL